ncbi:MAG: alpha-ketoglutarate-dependent dioxygenase AlkB [Acidobacteriota bacterium]
MNSFLYEPDLIDVDEEQRLLVHLRALSVAPLQMYGKPTKRRIANFGLDYRASSPTLATAPPIPPFLFALRERAAGIAGLVSATLEQALVTIYPAGASIGWHVHHPQFGDTVVAVSLQGRATLELRPVRGATMLRQAISPRSIYVLRPEVRYGHEHRVLAHEDRVSVTFRSIAGAGR